MWEDQVVPNQVVPTAQWSTKATNNLGKIFTMNRINFANWIDALGNDTC